MRLWSARRTRYSLLFSAGAITGALLFVFLGNHDADKHTIAPASTLPSFAEILAHQPAFITLKHERSLPVQGRLTAAPLINDERLWLPLGTTLQQVITGDSLACGNLVFPQDIIRLEALPDNHLLVWCSNLMLYSVDNNMEVEWSNNQPVQPSVVSKPYIFLLEQDIVRGLPVSVTSIGNSINITALTNGKVLASEKLPGTVQAVLGNNADNSGFWVVADSLYYINVQIP